MEIRVRGLRQCGLQACFLVSQVPAVRGSHRCVRGGAGPVSRLPAHLRRDPQARTGEHPHCLALLPVLTGWSQEWVTVEAMSKGMGLGMSLWSVCIAAILLIIILNKQTLLSYIYIHHFYLYTALIDKREKNYTAQRREAVSRYSSPNSWLKH